MRCRACYSSIPDGKGTERIQNPIIKETIKKSYSSIPDGKGTESINLSSAFIALPCVTAVSLMEKGLKEKIRFLETVHGLCYSSIPDGKGTESLRFHQLQNLIYLLQQYP